MKVTLKPHAAAATPSPSTPELMHAVSPMIPSAQPATMRTGSWWLRMIGAFSAGIVLFFAIEAWFPNAAKPSVLLGSASGNIKASDVEVQRAVNAATSRMQQEIDLSKGNVQALLAAFDTVYRRAEKLNEVRAQLAGHNAELRSKLAERNQLGNSQAIQVMSWAVPTLEAVGFGSQAAQLRALRDRLHEDSVVQLEASMARAVPDPAFAADWSAGLPNPASIRASMGMQGAKPSVIDTSKYPMSLRGAATRSDSEQ